MLDVFLNHVDRLPPAGATAVHICMLALPVLAMAIFCRAVNTFRHGWKPKHKRMSKDELKTIQDLTKAIERL